MPPISSDAIVLRTFKLGESSKIVVLLTRERGKLRAVAKGARGARPRYQSSLEPLSEVRVSLYGRQGTELFRLGECELVRSAFRAGARAYLTIDDAPELLRAFDKILGGHPHVAASVLPLILSNFAAGTKNSRNLDINNLSDRELEIFSFIGRGVSVSELATELHVSVKTIETHQMRMKEKLALHTAAELRQKAREWLAKSAVNRIREDPELE